MEQFFRLLEGTAVIPIVPESMGTQWEFRSSDDEFSVENVSILLIRNRRESFAPKMELGDPFLVFPDEILLEICRYLYVDEICLLSKVNRNWNRLAADDLLWWHLCDSTFRSLTHRPEFFSYFRTYRGVKSAYSRINRDVRWFCEYAGGFYSCVLSRAGDVYFFGRARETDLHLKLPTDGSVPKKVELPHGRKAVMLSNRRRHFGLIDDRGHIYTWGEGLYGKTGHGDFTDVIAPKKIHYLKHVQFKFLCVGRLHSLAISCAGRVWAWGTGVDGQLGTGTDINSAVPREIAGLEDIEYGSIGGGHSLVVNSKGEAFSFGLNDEGQLGIGAFVDRSRPNPITYLLGHRIVSLSAGWCHTIAASDNGYVWTFGRGCDGELGHGDRSSRCVPTLVESLRHIFIVNVSAGNMTACVSNRGTVYTWGIGVNGELGHGEHQNLLVPKRVESLRDIRIVCVSVGIDSMLGISDRGKVYCWGLGNSGRLGLGDSTERTVPTLVDALAELVVQPLAMIPGSSLGRTS